MTAEKRSCENCGNRICADSIVAIFWNDCVASGFTRHWMPYKEPEKPTSFQNKSRKEDEAQ